MRKSQRGSPRLHLKMRSCCLRVLSRWYLTGMTLGSMCLFEFPTSESSAKEWLVELEHNHRSLSAQKLSSLLVRGCCAGVLVIKARSFRVLRSRLQILWLLTGPRRPGATKFAEELVVATELRRTRCDRDKGLSQSCHQGFVAGAVSGFYAVVVCKHHLC